MDARAGGRISRSRAALGLTLLATVLTAAGAWWWIRGVGARHGELMGEVPRMPPGRWHVGHPEEARRADAAARLLSLPYLAGTQIAGTAYGVQAFHPERAQPGVNLYVSGHGPEALLLSLEGKILHRWRCDFSKAFPDRPRLDGTDYWRRVHLLPGGELLAIYQGNGMVKLDRDSRLLWALDLGFYNDFEIGPEGEIYAIGKEARVIPAVDPERTVLEDSIVVIEPSGAVRRRLSLWRAFAGSEFAALVRPLPAEADIFHSNTVNYLDGRAAAVSDVFRRGNLLVSLREIDVVAVVDPRRETVVWAARGPWKAQHEPTLSADGKLLVFDNRGAGGEARILEIDVASGEVLRDYRGPAERALYSPEAGSVQRLANGNLLITESERGRAYEITDAGEIVWDFQTPHRAGAEKHLVATLWEVTRLAPSLAAFDRDATAGGAEVHRPIPAPERPARPAAERSSR